ncbi:hypothetical protein [Motilibacter aurantiacus]|nr:hypothetical protein [Motilibacter aurantiacus]NHC43773.1 hypothetical protein [Motilibacter aurantiacus]
MFDSTHLVRPALALYAGAVAVAAATAQWVPALVIAAGAGAQTAYRRARG